MVVPFCISTHEKSCFCTSTWAFDATDLDLVILIMCRYLTALLICTFLMTYDVELTLNFLISFYWIFVWFSHEC
jgi:hypothetical protein